MAFNIDSFKLKVSENILELKLVEPGPISPTVDFILQSGEKVEDIQVTREGDTHTYTYAIPYVDGETSHGVYSADMTLVGVEDPQTVTVGDIGNISLAVLDKVLNGDFDCVLFQQLEAIKQYILANQQALASEIHRVATLKTATCSTVVDTYSLPGTNYYISSNNYVIG